MDEKTILLFILIILVIYLCYLNHKAIFFSPSEVIYLRKIKDLEEKLKTRKSAIVKLYTQSLVYEQILNTAGFIFGTNDEKSGTSSEKEELEQELQDVKDELLLPKPKSDDPRVNFMNNMEKKDKK